MVKRFPLPGWLLVSAMVVFVITWSVAPSQRIIPAAAASQDMPSRRAADTPPVTRMDLASMVLPGPVVKPIFSPRHKWQVAFTFDDGPHQAYTPRLLRTLARHDVQATFFINGYWLDERRRFGTKCQAIVKSAARVGHTIANHGLSHAKLPRLTAADQTREIMENHHIIHQLIGTAPTLFRPPYAQMTTHARRVLRRHGYTEALWNATAPDHEIQDPEQIKDTVMSWIRSYKGGIVMLHDRYRWSVEATALILSALKRANCRRLHKGLPIYHVVSLDSLLRPPPQSWALNIHGEDDREEQAGRFCD